MSRPLSHELGLSGFPTLIYGTPDPVGTSLSFFGLKGYKSHNQGTVELNTSSGKKIQEQYMHRNFKFINSVG